MISDSDTVSTELRSSEYECINRKEIKKTSKTSKTNNKKETVPMNKETNSILLEIRYKAK